MLSPFLTEEQKNRRTGQCEILHTVGGVINVVRLTGRIGTLKYFGFTPQEGADNLGALGISRQVTRKAHKRSRWLGDVLKTTLKENTARVMHYPSTRGTALAGEPVIFEAIETGVKAQIQVYGSTSALIAYLCEDNHAPPYTLQLWGKTGNRFLGVIPKKAAGGTLATQGSGKQPAPAAP